MYQCISKCISLFFILLVNKSDIWIIGPNISAEKRLHAIVELELF